MAEVVYLNGEFVPKARSRKHLEAEALAHEMADRIASWGYVVLAPNVFYRNGTANETSPDGSLDTDKRRADFFKLAGPRIAGLTKKVITRLPASRWATGAWPSST